MKTNTSSLVLAAALLASSNWASAQNLVSNGDFDETADSPQTAFAPSPWTLGVGTPDLVDVNYVVVTTPANQGGWLAPADSPDGGNYIGLYAIGAAGESISQNINGFIAGESYQLSFHAANLGVWWYSNNGREVAASGDGYLRASIFGQTFVTTAVPVDDIWHQYSFTFTATSSSANLQFFGRSTGSATTSVDVSGFDVNLPGEAYIQIDGISVTPVPEPSGALLLGLAGTLTLLRRRRAA